MAVFRRIFRYAGSTLILSGLCVLGFQVYTWFNLDHWFEMDLLWLVHWLVSTHLMEQAASTFVNWFHTPQQALEVHRLLLLTLDLVPLSLFLLLSGAFLFASIYRGEKERSRTIAAVESEMRVRVGDKYTSK